MHNRRFGIWTSQSKPWPETLAEWQLIEQLGFDCAGIVDHFMPTGGDLDGWFHEGWTLLAALAAAVPGAELHELPCGHNDCPRPWEIIRAFLRRAGLDR